MSKPFKLPKEFAERWLSALRSGDYKQTNGVLLEYEYDGETDEINCDNKSYCCIGVACSLTKIPENNYSGDDFVQSEKDDNGYVYRDTKLLIENGFPEELVGDYGFPNILASLNDGINEHSLGNTSKEFGDVDFDGRKPTELISFDKRIQYNFNKIADFIEKNTEFY